MATIYIMMGPSGAGKSTLAKDIAATNKRQTPHGVCKIVSADDFFLDDQEVYNYNPALIGDAHKECMRNFLEALRKAEVEDTIIVDNTNTKMEDVSPYVVVSMAYPNHNVRVCVVGYVEHPDDPKLRAFMDRNVHGVPPGYVATMAENLYKTLEIWPKHFPEPRFF